jgi:Vacuolar protein sorting-associated protein 62
MWIASCAPHRHNCVQDFQRAWHDDASRLTLWEPVPPAGYCALGFVTSTDQRKPPNWSAYCVRDRATRFATDRPVTAMRYSTAANEFTSQPKSTISLCVYDSATLALQKREPATEDRPCFVLALPSAGEGGSAAGGAPASGAAAAAQPISLHLVTSSVCVRVRNILRVPLLELETAGIDAECDVCADGGARATVNFSPEVWSYNAALKEWEPMVEKFPVRVRFGGPFA